MVSKMVKLAAVPASLALTSYGLYAVSDRQPRGDRLTPHQLSVYAAPPRESRFVEEQPGRVQGVFSALRLGLSPVVSGGKSFAVAIQGGVLESIQFGKDSYEYLKAPPPEFLPRVGIIAVSGLAGLVVSRRGSRLKKVLYPVGLTALGASLCYPAHAVIFAKVTAKKLYNAGQWTYDAASSLWKAKPLKEGTPVLSENKEAETVTTAEGPIQTQNAEPAQPQNTPDAPSESASPEPMKESRFAPPLSLSDHGQSSPEDADLYSTRS